MDDPRTLIWMDAVVVVENQSCGTLTAGDTGLETVALYHPQWHIFVKAGDGTQRAALVEHEAPLHRTAHSTECRTPPLQHHAGLSALTGVGLQSVTQTLVGVGPAGTQVVHTGPVPGLRRDHAMTGFEHRRLQHLTASVRRLLSLETRVFTGVNILPRVAGRDGMSAFGHPPAVSKFRL